MRPTGKVILGRPASRPSMRQTTLCPHCKNAVWHTDNFCKRCGLKLDWSDFKEIKVKKNGTKKVSTRGC